jgi:hypothetical protein
MSTGYGAGPYIMSRLLSCSLFTGRPSEAEEPGRSWLFASPPRTMLACGFKQLVMNERACLAWGHSLRHGQQESIKLSRQKGVTRETERRRCVFFSLSCYLREIVGRCQVMRLFTGTKQTRITYCSWWKILEAPFAVRSQEKGNSPLQRVQSL